MWSVFIFLTYIAFLLFVMGMSYKLGQTKTDNPRFAALIGFFLALFPPFGLIYLAVLAIKEDTGTV